MAMKKHGLFRKIMSSFLSASCALSMTAIGTTLISTTANAAVAPTSGDPSTFSWDNATVYFLLTDRFCNGDTSNDNAYGRQNIDIGDQRASFHGGDFAGITKKLNEGYFTDLGVNAIWLTAPYEQIHGYIQGGDNFYHYSYHGYYVLDYTEPDAAYGTKAEFQTMVDTAHSKGIRIIMDIVMNHAGYNSMGDMNEFNFGTLKSGWDAWYKNPDKGSTKAYHDYIDYASSAADWGRWWGDWVRSGLPGYKNAPGNDEKTSSLSGLPDFVTESSAQVNIPEFLKTKWTKEGTLSEKMSKYGSGNTVTGYISDWLSEWVRTYGIDGFRCDTAKHVDKASWKQLKDKCVAALKEWKQANPTKKLDDLDFWMTGEHWDWKPGWDEGYFTSGGFDSMINFDITGGGKLAAGTVAGTYQSYADNINSRDNYNVLSYISSHDSSLARPSDMYYLGSAFLLMPGAVQIYYGDESARPLVSGVPFDGNGGAGHSLRSDMNFGENTDLVAHWGIVGRFRNSHIAVGAGANVALTASSGIAFARTYDKGIQDKVAAVINASGSVSVDVSAIWGNGTTLENAYDGTTAVVTGGKVTFSAGAHGTILIQEPDGERGMVTVQHIDQDTGSVIKTDMVSGLVGESYTVSADAELTKTYDLVKTEGKTTGTFSADGATVKFYYHLDKTKFGTITITHVDAATGESIADSQTITGKVGTSYSAEPVDVKNYEVDLASSTNTSGTFKSNTDIKVVFKYNYVEPTGLTVHYYNKSWSKVNIYAYDKSETKKYVGAWPGTAMTNDGDGWWSYNFEDIEEALVIFNDGNNQEPGYMQPGYNVSGEVWLKDGVAASAGKVKVIYKGDDGKTLGTATLTGLEGETYTTSAKEFSGYTLSGTPSNASGKFTAGTTTVTYTYQSEIPPVPDLVNNSTLSATTIKLGSSVTATGKATGGTTPYQYQVVYKLSSASSWTTAKAYNATASVTFKPSKAGTYSVCIKVKDANNTEVKKFITLKVEASALVNNSTVSPTKVTLGDNVTVKCAASGGAGSYKYAVLYKASSASSWTTKQDFSTTTSVAFKFTGTGTKNICVKVKDAAGTIEKKYFDVTVVKGITNTSKLAAATINLGSSAKAVCSATGGTGYYNYAVFYKKTSDSKWTTAQNYSSNDTVTFKPASATTYDVCLKVKDTDGTESKKYVTLTVKAAELVNTSTVSSTSVTLGNSVTVKGSATGGAGSYKYAVFYKASTTDTWTTKQNFSTTASVAIKFSGTGTKNICVKVKDANGTIEKKYFDITVKASVLTNTSTISATSVVKGKAVVTTAAATGGTAPYQYAVYYKKSSASSWTTKQDFSTNTKCSMTFPSAEVYDICLKVKDAKGTVAKKYFAVSINTAATNLKNTSTVSASSVTKGTKVTIKGASSGATDQVLYQYSYKADSASNYTKIKDYSTATSAAFTPSEAGTYIVKVIAQDMKPSTAVKILYVTVK